MFVRIFSAILYVVRTDSLFEKPAKNLYTATMFVFMNAVLLACAVFVWMRVRDSAIRIVIITGFLAGVLVTMARAAFSFMHRAIPYSFMQNFLYYSVGEYTFPAVALFVAYFLVAKDAPEFKIKSFFPLTTAFYAAYMPYCIIASAESFYFFTLFVKPVLILAMLILYSKTIFTIYKNIREKSKNKVVHSFVLLGLAALVPPCIETLWLLNSAPFAVSLLSAAYIFSAVVSTALSCNQKIYS